MGASWKGNRLCGCSSVYLAALHIWFQGQIGETCFSLSLCLLSSISSSKVGGQEGAEGVTLKSIPLGHKSGIFSREKKGNTYATSTHFPCFVQNRSTCKTVLFLRDPPTGHHLPYSNGYRSHTVSHRKTRCVFFKPWGLNISQFFRIQFKGVKPELLAPICKREKKPPAPSFYWRLPPCSRWGCRQILHQSFYFLVGLNLSLTDAGDLLVPPGSMTELGWRCTRGRSDGIPDWRPAPHH